MCAPPLSDLEALYVAIGMMVERFHVQQADALSELVEDGAYMRRAPSSVARSIIVQAGRTSGRGDHFLPRTERNDPLLMHPPGLDFGATMGSEIVGVALGVLAERYGVRLADAAAIFAAHTRASRLSETDVAWELVGQARSMRLDVPASRHLHSAGQPTSLP